MRTLVELYQYRQMVFSLVKKDLRGRYKGSVLGFLWTFINPLMQLCIYTVVFSTIMRMGIEDFYIFLFVALVPWLFFSSCLQSGSTVIVNNQDLVKKIYFPRIVLPISYVTSSFVNMLFSFCLKFTVMHDWWLYLLAWARWFMIRCRICITDSTWEMLLG